MSEAGSDPVVFVWQPIDLRIEDDFDLAVAAYKRFDHPFDIQQQADTFCAGLMMAPEERRERHEACVAIVRGNDIDKWLHEPVGRRRRGP